MNIVNIIKNRIYGRACRNSRNESQDLFLYRELRRAENNLHVAREGLSSALALHATCTHDGGIASACPGDAAGHGIERLKNDVTRCEAEYQHAQMNVRSYFYLLPCSGRLCENDAPAGHPAQ